MSRDKSHSEEHCGCGCGCEHDHGSNKQECGCEHSHHTEEEGCGCGCGHCHGEKKRSTKREILKYILGAIPLVVAFIPIIPEPIRIILAVAVYAAFGFAVWKGMVKGFLNQRIFTEFTLMCVASVGAFIIGEYADAAAVVYLYSLGEYLSDQAYSRSKRNISELFEITPEYATVLREGELVRLSPKEVRVGETVILKTGERAPVDGRVTEGGADADVSSITGETTPLALCEGTVCPSGAVITGGAVSLEAISDYENSAVAKMTRAVEQAAKRKSRAERRISGFARIFTPVAFGVAAVVAVLGSLISGNTALWVKTGISILVVSCPCALLLSVPLTYFAGIGAAASRGIVFRGGEVIDTLANVKAAVFDKTGTLTDPEPTPCGVEVFGDVSEAEFIRLASDLLAYSPHVAAVSFCRSFPPHMKLKPEGVENIGGRGLVCRAEGRKMLFGNAALMRENGIDVADSKATAIFGACDGVLLGRIDFVSAIKADTAEAVSELSRLGIERMAIISGDAETAVRGVAEELAVNEYYFSVAPHEKSELLEKIMEEERAKNRKRRTLYCGDGLNDSAVIKLADVGVAIGEKGSALTAEQADVVLMYGGVEKLCEAIKNARRISRIAVENICLSLGVKLAVFAIGVITSSMGYEMPLELAVAADVGATLLAVLNAVRASKGVKKYEK